MSESVHTNTSIWSKGMMSVIAAQFLSAFGDNALLFATLALLKEQFYPDWSQPILQMVFVGAYILFAPFVGQVADSFAKGRVMMFANALKLLGAASICFGINPFLGYTLVGIGAAAYSPAKYGILGELTTGDKLVKANGLMEASTIAAILLGSVAGGVLADQWKEFFLCEALPANVLAVKGQKKTTRRSSNTHGDENIITTGSRIAVADGQCMLIVEQGKVVEVCAEPGEYTYDASTEPSIFAGNLGESIGEVFRNIGKRFTFGGEAPKDQRIYYFNTKELTGNKYGTPSPVPFRVVDQRAGIDIDIGIRCFGEYSYHIANPLLFYTNVCGNVTEDYTRDTLDGQLKSELLTALQPAFARISDMGIRYSALPGHTREIAAALNEELSAQWRDRRGLEIVAFGVSSVKADEADEQMIKDMQRDAAYMDPTRAAAMLSRSQGDAMKAAASNTATGPAMAFMGMGMAGQMGGVNAQDLYALGRQQAAQQPAAPAAGSWTCACGQTGNTGKFCGNCGRPRPAAPEGWTCVCGAVNKGKFCSECGRPKPAGTPKYKCDKCGWEPDDPTHPPKFCPECGDPFDDGDIQS